MTRTLLAVALLTTLAACGGSGSSHARATSSTTGTTTPATTSRTPTTSAVTGSGVGPCIHATPAEVRGYLGLALAAAQARARGERRTTRVVGEDGTCKLVTMDYSPDRVNLDLVHGAVAAASLG